jgi:hypothetical protein
MPGEVIMNKSAVDAIGADTLLSLNNNASRVTKMASGGVVGGMRNLLKGREVGGETNVWVVKEESVPPMSKNDVLVTIQNDILQGGATKQLIRSVSKGGI